MEYLSDPWESLLTNYAHSEAVRDREKVITVLQQQKVAYANSPEKLEVLEEIISIVRKA